jgi:methionine-rich copper-binding protein CopC
MNKLDVTKSQNSKYDGKLVPFRPRRFDKKDNKTYAQQQHQLTVQSNPNTPAGNYTLGISATDGTVTRSIFVDLIIEK